MLCSGRLFSAGAYAQSTKFTSKNGVAIKGYDPAAYFNQQKAVEGNDKYTFDWSGSKWKFASQNNLDSFKVAPEKYAPRYAGFWLMAPAKITCHPPTQKHGEL